MEASGLLNQARSHFASALLLRPLDTGMRLHEALMLPVLYSSKAKLMEERTRLLRRVKEMIALLPATNSSSKTLEVTKRVTTFATPTIFFIAYQVQYQANAGSVTKPSMSKCREARMCG